jgi:1-acyl-sn-glycerol-3-phosphate acyltransferase
VDRHTSGPGFDAAAGSPETADEAHESTSTGSSSRSLVAVEPPFLDAEPDEEEPLDDPRRSDVDRWGRSESSRRMARKITGFYFHTWFRVDWEGMENIPTDGGALLVANHAGAIPADAPMIIHGIEEDMGRPVYGLADYWFRSIPFVGLGWSRGGGVAAHPDNAFRLLNEEKQLVLVFPEGTKATSKEYRDRYQLRRFGRGGFVETAMRAGVPVVPIAVVGSEEAMPIIARLPSGFAKALGLPYLPLTLNHLVFGPLLGTVVWLPAKFRIRVLPPITFDVEPCQERYPRSRVMDEAESIRQLLQENLHDMLRDRRSPWFG